MDKLLSTFESKMEMLESFIVDTRKSFYAIKQVQAISSKPEAYNELLDGEEANAQRLKQEITEVLNGQF